MSGICHRSHGIAHAAKGLGSPVLPANLWGGMKLTRHSFTCKSGEGTGRGLVTCCSRAPRNLCFPVGRSLCRIEKGSEFAKVVQEDFRSTEPLERDQGPFRLGWGTGVLEPQPGP